MKTHAIVQWGEVKAKGSLEGCQRTAKRWTEQHGNIDLEVVSLKSLTTTTK